MKVTLIKLFAATSIILAGLVACSKEVKKDNSAEYDATREAADKSVKELDKE